MNQCLKAAQEHAVSRFCCRSGLVMWFLPRHGRGAWDAALNFMGTPLPLTQGTAPHIWGSFNLLHVVEATDMICRHIMQPIWAGTKQHHIYIGNLKQIIYSRTYFMLKPLKSLIFHFSFRPARSSCVPPCCFQTVLQVFGFVLDRSQLRWGHRSAGLHHRGETGRPGKVRELDRDNKQLQKHIVPRPLRPGASGQIPLQGQSLQLCRGQWTQPGVWLCGDGNVEWVIWSLAAVTWHYYRFSDWLFCFCV